MRACLRMAQKSTDPVGGFRRENVLEFAGLLFYFLFVVDLERLNRERVRRAGAGAVELDMGRVVGPRAGLRRVVPEVRGGGDPGRLGVDPSRERDAIGPSRDVRDVAFLARVRVPFVATSERRVAELAAQGEPTAKSPTSFS